MGSSSSRASGRRRRRTTSGGATTGSRRSAQPSRRPRPGGWRISSGWRVREASRPGAPEAPMRFYRLLLHLYPASFRREYGEEMAAIVARRLRDAPHAVARAWVGAAAAWETLGNALLVHLDLLRQDL